MRILKAINFKPKRTIRIALWSAEEHGLLGSLGYVKEHFADRISMSTLLASLIRRKNSRSIFWIFYGNGWGSEELLTWQRWPLEDYCSINVSAF